MKVNSWIRRAEENGSKYIIIMLDNEDKEEYPIYYNGDDIENEIKKLSLSEGRQSVMDVVKV